jgi:hypothetical protein
MTSTSNNTEFLAYVNFTTKLITIDVEDVSPQSPSALRARYTDAQRFLDEHPLEGVEKLAEEGDAIMRVELGIRYVPTMHLNRVT